MPIEDFHDEWTKKFYKDLEGGWTPELCQKIEAYGREYVDLFKEKLLKGSDIRGEDWDRLFYFIGFYNCSRFSCGNQDGSGLIEPELAPSLDWIHRIVFPDAPHPRPVI